VKASRLLVFILALGVILSAVPGWATEPGTNRPSSKHKTGSTGSTGSQPGSVTDTPNPGGGGSQLNPVKPVQGSGSISRTDVKGKPAANAGNAGNARTSGNAGNAGNAGKTPSVAPKQAH
jgi:hypothetical protein